MDERFVPSSPLGERLAQRRETVLKAAARRHATNVRVFGSVARGAAHETSDIDLLVDLDESASLLDLIGLERELQEELGVKVQVGSAASLKPLIRDEVLTTAIAL